jgi:hypothetical protein
MRALCAYLCKWHPGFKKHVLNIKIGRLKEVPFKRQYFPEAANFL